MTRSVNSTSSSPASGPSSASARLPRLVGAAAGRHAAVDQHLGPRGDHVVLLGRARASSAPSSPAASARRCRPPAGGERPRRRSTAPSSSVPSAPSSSSPSIVSRERDPLRGRLAAAAGPSNRASAGASFSSALSPSAGTEACPAVPRARRKKRLTPFSPTQSGVEAPAVELERGAAALVDDQVAAHRLGVLGAQPLRAERRAHLLVGGDHQLQRARARAASPSARARSRRRPRPPPGPSCPARRGPRTTPSTTSPDQGLKLHSAGSAGTVSTWPSRHRVSPSRLAREVGDQVRSARAPPRAA